MALTLEQAIAMKEKAVEKMRLLSSVVRSLDAMIHVYKKVEDLTDSQKSVLEEDLRDMIPVKVDSEIK
jgi:hypothetical protein